MPEAKRGHVGSGFLQPGRGPYVKGGLQVGEREGATLRCPLALISSVQEKPSHHFCGFLLPRLEEELSQLVGRLQKDDMWNSL